MTKDACRLKEKLMALQFESQEAEERQLRENASRNEQSQRGGKQVVLVFDFDTLNSRTDILLPGCVVEFTIRKLLAAMIPISLLVTGIDLEILNHLNPNFLSKFSSDPLLTFVSLPWTRVRSSIFPEALHLTLSADVVTRTEIGIRRSRVFYIPSSDVIPLVLPLISSSEYSLLLVDKTELAILSPRHPYQAEQTISDTCVLSSPHVQTTGVRTLVLNARGNLSNSWKTLLQSKTCEDCNENIEQFVLEMCDAAEGGNEIVGFKIDLLGELSKAEREPSETPVDIEKDILTLGDVTSAVTKSLADLQTIFKIDFVGLSEERVSQLSSTPLTENTSFVATPNPPEYDPLISVVKPFFGGAHKLPEYHYRLMLFSVTPGLLTERKLAVKCLEMVPNVIPPEGAETLDMFLSSAHDDDKQKFDILSLIHYILSQYSSTYQERI